MKMHVLNYYCCSKIKPTRKQIQDQKTGCQAESLFNRHPDRQGVCTEPVGKVSRKGVEIGNGHISHSAPSAGQTGFGIPRQNWKQGQLSLLPKENEFDWRQTPRFQNFCAKSVGRVWRWPLESGQFVLQSMPGTKKGSNVSQHTLFNFISLPLDQVRLCAQIGEFGDWTRFHD